MNQQPKDQQKACDCVDSIEKLGKCDTSCVEHCTECHKCQLVVTTEFIRTKIDLAHFYDGRVKPTEVKPLLDTVIHRLATEMMKALVLDMFPDKFGEILYNADSPEKLGTLQAMVRAGITAVELDRVMGDGKALTALAEALPHQPYGPQTFRTEFDVEKERLDRIQQRRAQTPDIEH